MYKKSRRQSHIIYNEKVCQDNLKTIKKVYYVKYIKAGILEQSYPLKAWFFYSNQSEATTKFTES